MAKLPLPVGLGAMLSEFATALGESARILPERSRSVVGAVALKRAEIAIDFEMTAIASRKDGTVGVGARSFLLGAGASISETETTARNRGRITLEIVAIAEAPAPGQPQTAQPARPSPLDPARTDAADDKPDIGRPTAPAAPDIRSAIAKVQSQIDAAHRAGRLDRNTLAKAEQLLANAAKAAQEGDTQSALEFMRNALAAIG